MKWNNKKKKLEKIWLVGYCGSSLRANRQVVAEGLRLVKTTPFAKCIFNYIVMYSRLCVVLAKQLASDESICLLA